MEISVGDTHFGPEGTRIPDPKVLVPRATGSSLVAGDRRTAGGPWAR